MGSGIRNVKKLVRAKRKIRFYRNKWWKFPKFRNKPSWRRPKGNDNPMRLKLKGQPPAVSIGFRTPKEIRGLHPSGLRPVIIHSVKDLELLKPSEVIIYIGGGVGARKRRRIVNKARELGFTVTNEGVHTWRT